MREEFSQVGGLLAHALILARTCLALWGHCAGSWIDNNDSFGRSLDSVLGVSGAEVKEFII